MPCYHPVKVKISRKGIYSNVLDSQDVPCGICLGCRAEQARQWSVRILHEAQMHAASWFVTLTYDNERIPPNGSLDPTHFSSFIKTVRRDEQAGKVSYFACGEYGEITARPHYHAVLFGPRFLDRYLFRGSDSSPIWRSPTLEAYWPHGLTEFGTVTAASAAYVAGYVRKKVSKKCFPHAYMRYDDNGELFDIEPEFSRMSLRPAIGRTWLEKYWQDVYPRDFVLVDGKEFKPPRYYDKWMDHNHPEMMLQVRQKRYDDIVDKTDYQLAAGEKIHEARVELFQERGKI